MKSKKNRSNACVDPMLVWVQHIERIGVKDDTFLHTTHGWALLCSHLGGVINRHSCWERGHNNKLESVINLG